MWFACIRREEGANLNIPSLLFLREWQQRGCGSQRGRKGKSSIFVNVERGGGEKGGGNGNGHNMHKGKQRRRRRRNGWGTRVFYAEKG